MSSEPRASWLSQAPTAQRHRGGVLEEWHRNRGDALLEARRAHRLGWIQRRDRGRRRHSHGAVPAGGGARGEPVAVVGRDRLGANRGRARAGLRRRRGGDWARKAAASRWPCVDAAIDPPHRGSAIGLPDCASPQQQHRVPQHAAERNRVVGRSLARANAEGSGGCARAREAVTYADRGADHDPWRPSGPQPQQRPTLDATRQRLRVGHAAWGCRQRLAGRRVVQRVRWPDGVAARRLAALGTFERAWCRRPRATRVGSKSP